MTTNENRTIRQGKYEMYFPSCLSGSAITLKAILLFSVIAACTGCAEESNFTPAPAVPGTWRKVREGIYLTDVPRTGKISFDDAGIFVNARGEVIRFDPETFSLTKLSDFPGAKRGYLVTTARVGKKGYVGGGYDYQYFNDFWEYDFNSDTWKRLANYPLPEIAGAFGFSIGGKLYAGAGHNSDQRHYVFTYEFNPATNEWLPKANFPGYGDILVEFNINNRGFVGTPNSFWEYDAEGNSWLKRKLPPIEPNGNRLSCFSEKFGYILAHEEVDGVYITKYFYSYNPKTDSWTRLADFSGNTVVDRVFAIKGKVYAATTADGTASLWEYTPF